MNEHNHNIIAYTVAAGLQPIYKYIVSYLVNQ